MSIQEMSASDLRRAADLKEQIEDLNEQLTKAFNGHVARKNGTHRLSYAGRKRIADAQKKRWKAFHKQKDKR